MSFSWVSGLNKCTFVFVLQPTSVDFCLGSQGHFHKPIQIVFSSYLHLVFPPLFGKHMSFLLCGASNGMNFYSEQKEGLFLKLTLLCDTNVLHMTYITLFNVCSHRLLWGQCHNLSWTQSLKVFLAFVRFNVVILQVDYFPFMVFCCHLNKLRGASTRPIYKSKTVVKPQTKYGRW